MKVVINYAQATKINNEVNMEIQYSLREFRNIDIPNEIKIYITLPHVEYPSGEVITTQTLNRQSIINEFNQAPNTEEVSFHHNLTFIMDGNLDNIDALYLAITAITSTNENPSTGRIVRLSY